MKKSTLAQLHFVSILLTAVSCGPDTTNTIKPQVQSITESVYASGVVKARDQYEAYTLANGPIQAIFVEEGDSVKAGQPILQIFSESEKLRRESAELARQFADQQANQNRLRDLELAIQLAQNKLQTDSLNWVRTQNLQKQGIGTLVDLEQKQLAFQNSKTSYESALLRYQDLKREINFNSQSASKNLRISEVLEDEYLLKSKIDGMVYSLPRKTGEMVNPQIPLAIIGRAGDFLLELQVDEYDISRVEVGQKVLVFMDSFKEQTLEAIVSRVIPIMDSKSKTFTVEANFTKQPPVLFPNLTLEANILIQSRENSLVIPRNYLIKDTEVLTSSGDTILVKVGIKNYQFAEILEGISAETELILPQR